MFLNWQFIVILVVCILFLLMVLVIFLREVCNRWIGQSLLIRYKRSSGYGKVLSSMKKALETEYPLELWEDKLFYEKYINLYKSFCQLRMMAKRKYNGKIDPDAWSEFDQLEIPGMNTNSIMADSKPEKGNKPTPPKPANQLAFDFVGDILS